MVASGVVLWAVKERPKHAKSGKTGFGLRLVDALNIGAVAGLPIAFATYFLANRLLPVQMAERSSAEVNAFFYAWAAAVLAGFLCILGEEIVRTYANRILNVHPSLIPAFCGKGYYGLRVHQAALDYGVKVTGATVHFVNEIPDGGAIILQKAVAVQPQDTPETLQLRVMRQAEWELLPKAVSLFCEGRIRLVENKAVIDSQPADGE